MVTVVTLSVVGLTLAASDSAEAVVVQWGTNSGSTPNYQANVNGDFLMAGNGVLACTGTTGSNGTCNELHSTSTNTNNVNDNFLMTNTNTVQGFTTNSSSAVINVPEGATVVKAFLTWSANTGAFTGDSRWLCAQYSAGRGVATMPTGSTTGYLSRSVQLKVGGAAITNVAPQSMLTDPTSQATARYYSASADVTSAFAGVPTGSDVTVSAGNIWTPTGAGCYAGWSVSVVYDFGTYIAGNPASVPHSIVYYEGHVRQGASDPALTVAFNNFTAVAAGTRAGFTLFEGDRNITGDTASYSRGTSTTYTAIANPAGATDNIGVGRAEDSVRYTGTGSVFTNQSVDVATASLTNVVAGDSTVRLRLGTSGDSYLLRNAILSVPTAGLQLVKSYDGTSDTQSRTAGELATFTIRITNTGAGTLRNIVVEDDQADCSRSLGTLTLAPLASTTFTCTAAAPSSTGYVSTANATAYTAVGNFLAQDTDSTTVLLSAISLTKTSALAPGATGRAGDVLTYTFTVTNTGQSTLTGISITDPLPGLSPITFGAWPGTPGTLTAGQSVTATATYTLTQNDVDAGSIANTATVTAADEDGGVSPSGSANRVTPIAAAASISVTKTGALASGATGRVGDRITYTFTFRNTGNVTLENASLVDPLPGLSPPVITWPTGTAGSLPVGQAATATASYTITQADVDAGSVRNTATVTARTPSGATATGTSPQVQVATIASAPALTTTKSGAVTSGTGGVGSTITYTFTVRNTGNTTLSAVSIADPLAGLSALTYTWPGTAGRLAPGQSATATAAYTVTQADVDAGSVRNTAVGTATTPAGAVLTVPSSQSTVPTVAAAPAVALSKSGTLAPGSTGRAGDTVNYSFTLANTGNVTLTGAAIADPLAGLSALTYAWPGAAGTLAPGQSVTATATYVLKQSDVDAGAVANTATATARPPAGAVVTQTRSATVPVAPSGALAVLKAGTVTAGNGGVGSTVTYTFSATNTGNVTLSQVALSDPLSGLSAISYTWPGTAGTLAPGQTVQASATYTVRQADVDAGRVTNTATASGRTPAGTTVTGASQTTTVNTVAAAPGSTTTKTASVSGTGRAGDVITYTVRTTNTGNVTLTDVVITDPLPGLSAFTMTWPGAAGRLAPGQTAVGVATYTIRQADVDAGSVRNTASSSGVYGTATVTSASGAVVTPTATAAPSLITTKSGALQSGSAGRAGDTVVWTISLRNAGNVTLTGVAVSDSLPGISAPVYGTWPSGTAGVLAPGQTVTATATSTISQTDVNSGAVSNTATGSGLPPGGAAVTSIAPATVSLASAPGIALVKTGAVTSGNGGVGSTITYSFRATNTGNVTLSGVAVNDPHAGLSALSYTWPGAAGTLQPGQTVTATATYVIRQSDVDAGAARNTATVSGTPPTGAAVTASSGEVSVATIAAGPALTTTKSATGAGGGVGSTVTYSFRATNTGNVTLSGVSIDDPLPGLSTLEYSWPGTAGVLAPGQSVTATAAYTLSQADVDAGSVANTSTARGTGGGTTVSASSPAVVTPTAAGAPAIAVTKTGALAGSGAAGDTIDYAFTVRNTGNVTLTGVALTDPLLGAQPLALTGWTGAAGTLAPGQAVTATATYTVAQSDVDAGSVANTATATGAPPRGAAVIGVGLSTVPIAGVPAIAVTKTGAITAGDGGVGSTVTFALAIRNAGNVTLTGVSLNDSLPGLSTPVITWPGAAGTLAPGQTANATATYQVRQADVDAGSVRNTASVSGRPPAGPVVSAASAPAVVPTVAAVPGLTVTKTAAANAGTGVGDVVGYSIRVENSGNQTLTGVAVADALPGLSGLTVTWPGTAGVLAPGQAAIARGTYAITQADVDAGTIRNTATATATAPGGVRVDGSATRDTPTAAAAPRVTLVKSAALAAGATGRAGDIVTYSFTVRNAGNVTLTGVAVADPLPGLSPLVYSAWPAAAGTLLPGQSVTATATRALTQADVDAGSVANTAQVTGTPPSGPAVQQSAAATLPLVAGPALTLAKTGAYTDGSGAVGSTITYGFTAQNTGNVTLTGVEIADPHTGLGPIALTWPGTAGTLAPGAQVTGTATYTVTQADVDAGVVRNTATVVGASPSGVIARATSPTVVIPTVAAGPALDTTKTASVTGSGAVGDVVDYTLRATNVGNVTLRSVTITDPLPGLTPLQYTWPGAAGTLAPGQTVTATASHTITQADVDSGALVNAATASGTAPGGTAVSDLSPTVTTPTVAAVPQLQVAKSGSLPTGAAGIAGETITWTVTIRNSGNVTLTGVTAADSLPGISDLTYGPWPGGADGTLAPGQSVTATATSVVRQSDVDAGSVANVATATGTPARGQAATASGAATVTLAAAPSLSIDKAGAYADAGTGAVGDTVRYTYTVRNTGNVTLSGVTVNDPHNGLSAITYGEWPSGTAGTLAPTQTVTATATYTVRQSDVNTGSITDTATVGGRTPAGSAVSATSQTVVLPTAVAAPGILTTKSAAVGGSGAVGDLITYTLRATNTGNVTLSGVSISDPAPGLTPIVYGAWPSASGILQPGQSVVATTTHRITQGDVDRGGVLNTASSTGTPPNGPAVSDASDTVTAATAAQRPDILVAKTGVLAPGAQGVPGDVVNFAFSLRNTGNVTLTGVALEDLVPGVSALTYAWPGATGTLAPGQTVTATATYALTQTDLDAGAVSNVVRGTATSPSGAPVAQDAGVSVPIGDLASPAVSVANTGSLPPGAIAGSVVTWTYVLTNTGNVTLSGASLADALAGTSAPVYQWTTPEGQLGPGESVTATATTTLTQADVDAGSIVSLVTGRGLSPAGAEVTASAPAAVEIPAPAAVTLDKSADKVSDLRVGDVITFTFDVRNTGQLTLDGVTLSDLLPGLSEITYDVWPGAPGTLAPGERITARATYTVTQADVDSGGIDNTSTVTGHPPRGESVQATDTVVLTAELANPAITLDKSGAAGPVRVGDALAYEFTVANSGNVTLTGVDVADDLEGLSGLSFGAWPSGERGVLAPGQVVRATAQYTVTQADVDRGGVDNTAIATGAAPSGQTVADDDAATTPAEDADPALAVTKTGALAAGSTGRAGDTAEFRFSASNTGDVTLTDVRFTDTLPGIGALTVTWPGVEGVLAPGQQATAVASYTLLQSDVDAGAVGNTVIVDAVPARGAAIEGEASATVPIAPGAALTAVKTGALTGGGIGQVGDVIQYEIVATNTGNVTIFEGGLIDPMPGLYDVTIAWSGTPGQLNVGESVTGRGKYRITQADVDRGFIQNTGTVGGETPAGAPIQVATNTVIINTVLPAPGLSVTKTGAATGSGAVNDEVAYDFAVTNSGNVTLTGVTLQDALPEVTVTAITWPDPARPGTLAPGQTATADGALTIRQAHVDAGRVLNTATATGTPPGAGTPVSATSPESVVPTASAAPALTITDTGALAPGATGAAGDVVTWTYVLTNAGNVTLTGASLEDALPGIGAPAYTWTTPEGELPPGASVTATATYTLTQADVDAGSVTSVVTGTGAPQVGAAVSATTAATVAIDRSPELVVTKVPSSPEAPGVGDTVRYDFTIENRGNVTLGTVALVDTLVGLSTPEIVWPGADQVLVPGEVATASATYVVTQADVDAGSVVNSASATATAPGGAVVVSPVVEATTATQAPAPSLGITKSAAVDGAGGVGDTVWYTIVVENTGNVTLHDVTGSDRLEGLTDLSVSWPHTEGLLAPGESLTASATYAITQADVDRGSITNIATATGTPPTGDAVGVTSAENVVTLAPAVVDAVFSKQGRLEAGATGEVGDLVEFLFTLRNTGSVTLADVAIADELDGLSDIEVSWPAEAGVLAPGTQTTAIATYALTQADIDRGFIDNTAVLTAVPARGDELSRTGTVRVAIPQTPGLSAVKTGVLTDGGIGQVGDIVQYEVVATNTGNVTIANGGLIDPMPGLYDVSITWPDPAAPGRVGVGESAIGRGSYALTQADVDRGYVENTAQVGADAPDGTRITADTNTVRVQTVQAAGALRVEKTGIVGGDGGVGAPVEYDFVIRNTGNVTVSGITLSDPLPGLTAPVVTWPGVEGVLAPGQQATATAGYTITQADVDAGSIANAATAAGSSRGGTVTSSPGIATVQTQGVQASIVVSKTGALSAGATGAAGDVVEWAYALRNTSNVTLTGVALTDRLEGSTAPTYVWPNPARPGVLLPGETVTATSAYTLTQADVDRGSVSSVVDGIGTPPRGAGVTGEAAASVLIESRPGLVATKAGAASGDGEVGDTIDYHFTVTNSGNVTLTLVDLVDALAGVSAPVFDWPGAPGVLAPGETVAATADYEITQADLDRGTVTNIATAQGKPPVGDLITASTPSTQTTVAPALPALALVKTAEVDGAGAVGDTVDYSFAIENTGNVTLGGIVLADPLPGLSAPVIAWPGETGELAPGERATATAGYAITQADVDAGSVVNTASVTGAGRGGEVTASSGQVVTPTIQGAPAFAVSKQGALEPGGVGEVGELVFYTVVVRNTGNQTLSGVDIVDTLEGLSDIEVVWPGAEGMLAVGGTVTGTATYALTQADIDAGAVSNVVTVEASAPGGALDPVADAATVEVPQSPALSAVKTGVLTGGGIGQVGDVIQYEVTATNVGNVTVTEGALVDPMPGLYDVSIAWPTPDERLEVGQSVTGRGKYRLTQADVDRGYVENTATVGARAPSGDWIEIDTNTVRISTVLPAPALAVTKSGTATGDGGLGDDVDYDFTVANTGNVTLDGVTLTDALPGVSVPVIDWPGADGVLAPGQVATATARYAITQADVDAGEVRNIATAGGTTPGDETIAADSAVSVVPTQPSAPAVTISNTGVLAAGSTGRAGDTVTWTYAFTNTGNVTLSSVALSDALVGVGDPAYRWPGSPGVLAPGQTVSATASYVLTQADVDAGAVTSLVTGIGTPSVGAAASAAAPATVSVAAAPGLVFEKTAALADPGADGVGDQVIFGFRLENTGTVTLSGIRIADELPGLGAVDIDWPGADGTLAPGQIATGAAPYAIRQEDVDRGQVQNTATATGTAPGGGTVTAEASSPAIETAAHAPAMRTVKSGAFASGDGGVGSVIEYSFEVTNTGNVTLRLIRVEDELPGVSTPVLEFPSTTGILAPGATAVGTARYTVTQADVDAGAVTNLATSFGTSPVGTVVSADADAVVIATAPQVPPAEAIETEQSARLADGDTGVLGDVIDYTFTITNTGNTTLVGVELENTLSALDGLTYTWPDPANPGRLLPGQSVSVTASHTITQADVDAGAVRNTAVGSGTRPRGGDVSDASEQTVVALAESDAALRVTKLGTRTGDGTPGTGVDYTFTVTNTGEVTVTAVELTDDLAGLGPIGYGAWPGDAGRLAPGESVTAFAAYTITQDDVDRGAVLNTASASAVAPDGDSIAAASPESVVPTVAAAPLVELQKTQQLADGATGRPGELVDYAFTITNAGNVTLRDVALSDGQSGLSAIRITWPGEPGVLAPGQTATAVAEYTLTQADVDAGGIGSTATVSGTGRGIVATDTADGSTGLSAAPAISLDKTAELETVAQQGAGVRYRIVVANTGNVTLSGVDVTDALPGLGTLTATWPGVPGELAAGESAEFTARYVIGQADVDRGTIVNTATAVGASPDGTTVEAADEHTIEVPSVSAIALDMSITVAAGQRGVAGDTLEFRYTGTNTGTTTLTGVRITDPYPGLSAPVYTWPGAPGVLLPGQSVIATATVTISEAMAGTVIASRAVVTSTEAATQEPVTAAASASLRLPEVAPDGLLPFTGGEPAPALGVAAALLLAGLVLLVGARRRRGHARPTSSHSSH